MYELMILMKSADDSLSEGVGTGEIGTTYDIGAEIGVITQEG